MVLDGDCTTGCCLLAVDDEHDRAAGFIDAIFVVLMLLFATMLQLLDDAPIVAPTVVVRCVVVFVGRCGEEIAAGAVGSIFVALNSFYLKFN